jgi:hypothetical protein
VNLALTPLPLIHRLVNYIIYRCKLFEFLYIQVIGFALTSAGASGLTERRHASRATKEADTPNPKPLQGLSTKVEEEPFWLWEVPSSTAKFDQEKD